MEQLTNDEDSAINSREEVSEESSLANAVFTEKSSNQMRQITTQETNQQQNKKQINNNMNYQDANHFLLEIIVVSFGSRNFLSGHGFGVGNVTGDQTCHILGQWIT